MIGKKMRMLVVAVFALVAVAAVAITADAQKVANPGAIAITSETGNMRVNSEEFDFDSSTQITFNGSLNAAGGLTIPRANVVFPDQFTTVDSPIGNFTFRIRITANNDATGVLNPLTGLTTLSTSLRIDIDPQGSSPPGFGGDCRVTPINVALSSAKPTGVPYNTSTGRVTVADQSFNVPGAQGCGSFLGTSYDGEINGALGLPTSNTSATITALTNPKIQKGVRAEFNATPTSGDEPLPVAFDAGNSFFAAAGTRTYAWDFDGNGTFDQTSTSPTANHTYVNAGNYTAKLRVTDSQGDSDETTKTINVAATRPDLAIDKTHVGSEFVASTEGVYKLEVDNVGNDVTSGTVTVTDNLPAGLTYVSATGTDWSCGNNGQLVTCTHAGPLSPGNSLPEIELKVNVDGSAVPSVTNSATVATADDQNPNNNTDDDVTPVLRPEPDLSLDKTHVGELLKGRRATYQLTATNLGSQPTGDTVTLTDTLPAGTSFVSAFGLGWECSFGSGTVTCTTDQVATSGNALPTVQIRVDVSGSAPATIENTGTVSVNGDANGDNNSDTDTAEVRDAGADFVIDKSHAGTFMVGTNESYQLSVRNAGSLTGGGPIVVTDHLPTGLTPQSASGSGWDCQIAGQDVTCTRDTSLEAGQFAPQITLTVAVDSNALPGVTNSAGVSAPNDLDPLNNSDFDATDVVAPAPDLGIDKSHVGNFTAGKPAAFSLKVKNNGADATTGTITVTDNVPANFVVSSVSGTGWNCNSGQNITCTRSAALAPGATAPEIVINGVPNRFAPPSVSNTASVATPNDANAANDSDTDVANVSLPAANTQPVTSIQGSVTYPSTASGNATFTINVTRGLLQLYSGTVKIVDPGANHNISGTVGIFNSVGRTGLNGATGNATLSNGQRILWSVDDLSALNLGNDEVYAAAPSGYNTVTARVATAGNITVLPAP